MVDAQNQPSLKWKSIFEIRRALDDPRFSNMKIDKYFNQFQHCSASSLHKVNGIVDPVKKKKSDTKSGKVSCSFFHWITLSVAFI
jgi:hypothetical protein